MDKNNFLKKEIKNNFCCNSKKENCFIDFIKIKDQIIPKISTELKVHDIISGWLVRWNIKRMNYKLNPGLYAIGNPDKESFVFVTANYKLTFDKLRKELTGLNAWILVLDTKGINVWCAAGKRTFGTQELLKRIQEVKLKEIVNHRKLILPQLGAPGISAHIIKKASGFIVNYGPVRAKDIKEYLENKFKKNENMKKVTFNIIERIAVIPVEIVSALKFILIILGVLFVLNVIKYHSININFLFESIFFIGAVFAGCVFMPILLPYIPVKSFALKGFIIGLIWALLVSIFKEITIINIITNILLLTSISSFFALNFTGTSTYTSISGVKIEVKIATPIIIISLISGLFLKVLINLNVIN